MVLLFFHSHHYLKDPPECLWLSFGVSQPGKDSLALLQALDGEPIQLAAI